MRAVIFGAGGMGQGIYREVSGEREIVAFWDNSPKSGSLLGLPVKRPGMEDFLSNGIDQVILGACYPSMKTQLLEMGIPREKIDSSFVDRRIVARECFIKSLARLGEGIGGACAEAGVFQGEFAAQINRCFPDRRLYLFDTFEGFHPDDVEIERSRRFSAAAEGQYGETSEALVLGKMEHPENCVVRKGYFPQSAQGIDDEFFFVNLDMDLYRPTLEGLRFFGERMVRGGCILVHDYFSHYRGVGQAVTEYLEGRRLAAIPIGDEISIAVAGF